MPIHWRGVVVLLGDIIAAFVENRQAAARPNPPMNHNVDPDADLRNEVIDLIRDLERHPDVQHDPEAPEDVDDIQAMDNLQLLQMRFMLLQLRAELDEPPPAHLINGPNGRRIGTLREFVDQHYQARQDAIVRAGIAQGAQNAQNAQNPQNGPQAVNLNINGQHAQVVHVGNIGVHDLLDIQAAVDENEPVNFNINGRNIQALPIGPIQGIGQHTVQAIERALHDQNQPAANAEPNNIPQLIQHLATVEQLRDQQYHQLRTEELARRTRNPGIREEQPEQQRLIDNNLFTLRTQLRDVRAQLHILRQIHDGPVNIEQRRHDDVLAIIRGYATQATPQPAPPRQPPPLVAPNNQIAPNNHLPNVYRLEAVPRRQPQAHPMFAPHHHTRNVHTLVGFDPDALEDEDDRRCPICLAQFENGDRVRRLGRVTNSEVVCILNGTLYILYQNPRWIAYQVQRFLGLGDHPMPLRMEIFFGHAPACVWLAVQSYLCYLALLRIYRRHKRGWPEEIAWQGRFDFALRAFDIRIEPGEFTSRIRQQPKAPFHPMFEVKRHKVEVRTFVGTPDPEKQSDFDDKKCVVCWADLAEGQKYWELPCDHKHRFHQDCIEEYWKQEFRCLRCTKVLEWQLAVRE
ncbi:uncharacterized protein AB675_888 [Cyphellophora attinorum]|uniref:RING-type domain-containing protein n=1 Tax=Cyphellophora attinorum TaxID=1664694 RepID=A0A0N1P2N2_9EURO|nr:uncharacterized protein AB675_888 [Phialophora attinorum]KPI45583.1 hypothetical protein AB675_888 [Phialophora attinorum]